MNCCYFEVVIAQRFCCQLCTHPGNAQKFDGQHSLVEAGDEIFELVSEARAYSLAGAADLGCRHCCCYLLHQPLPTALHHLHQI